MLGCCNAVWQILKCKRTVVVDSTSFNKKVSLPIINHLIYPSVSAIFNVHVHAYMTR